MACHLSKMIPSSRQITFSKLNSHLYFLPGCQTGSNINSRNKLHATAPRALPCAALLPLPYNIQDINASEMGCFSPLRERDINGSVISSHDSCFKSKIIPRIDITIDSDPHIGSYDCRGAVNLSSSMQSNVPSPFGGQHSFLGMPGSQWGQGHKYLSDHLHGSHYLNLRNTYSRSIHGTGANTGTFRSYHTSIILARATINKSANSYPFNTDHLLMVLGNRCNSRTMSNETPQPTETEKPLSRKEQLKRAVSAYGSTVIVFHVAISLASLGSCYLLVSSGLDIMSFMQYLGLQDSEFIKKATANAGTFVVAYAVHKVFAPVRIGITLTATPFIVRYLRRVGILKAPIKPT